MIASKPTIKKRKRSKEDFSSDEEDSLSDNIVSNDEDVSRDTFTSNDEKSAKTSINSDREEFFSELIIPKQEIEETTAIQDEKKYSVDPLTLNLQVVEDSVDNINLDSQDFLMDYVKEEEEFIIATETDHLKINQNNEKNVNDNEVEVIRDSSEILRKIENGEYKLREKQGRSRVWMMFNIIIDEEGNVVPNTLICKTCRNLFKSSIKKTSNLLRHKCCKLMENTKIQVQDNFQKEAVKIFTQWILTNCRPLKIIEDSDLRSVASFLISVGAKYGPSVDVDLDSLLPNSKSLSKYINNLYEICFNKVKAEIAEIKNTGYSLSSDFWTDSFSKKTYMALTIHYTKGTNLVSNLLGLKSMRGEECDGTNIRMKVETLLREFDCELDDKVLIVINNDEKNIGAFQCDNHIFCINNLIEYALKKSIEEVSVISALCRLCSKVVRILAETSVSSDLQATLESFGDIRQNSMFHLLSACQKHWDEIINILEKNSKLQITFHEWSNVNLQTLNSVVNLLQHFEEVMQKLKEVNVPTLHWTIIYVHKLKKKCGIEANDSRVVKELKEKLIFYIDNSVIDNLSIYHKIALFLFPPANKLVQYSQDEKSTIKEKCKTIMKTYEIEDSDCTVTEPTSENAELFNDFFVETESKDNITFEIDAYVSVHVKFLDKFDVLEWWNSHQNEFPLLYKLSCRILATPASNSASERIFHKARNLIADDRFIAESKHDDISEIMFLHANMQENTVMNL